MKLRILPEPIISPFFHFTKEVIYGIILESTEYFLEVVYDYNIILRSTAYLWEVVFIFHIILGSTEYLKSRQCLPFYFRKHCLFIRSCLNLPFYHVWFRWRNIYNLFITQIDHVRLGPTTIQSYPFLTGYTFLFRSRRKNSLHNLL